ncbi:MAG TPA: 3-hydroxyacyl-ACP dehydratase FabZ family protein [Planctomycetota bacterium]|nr:3-hydroxyacyl-ACP dehydratase FabZ family protein [Planctomycetota bacterium]
MRFELIDRITAVKPGHSLQAIKALSLAEEYLQDHFPGRPVMPGVMMVEAMVQACAWMVRLETDFAPSVVLLREARSVRYGQFVYPGDLLKVDVTLLKRKDGLADFKGHGSVDGQVVVSGRLELMYYSLADENPAMLDVDESIRREMRRRCQVICTEGAGSDVATPAG